MHEILHFIGLCPDSITHYDLTDFLMLHAKDFTTYVNNTRYYIWGLMKGI